MAKGILARLAAIEDGDILRLSFFAMLLGTASVLLIDYMALSADTPPADPANIADPVLPAVDRPEIDPGDPAFRPHETITTPEAVLTAPLAIELGPQGVLALTGTIGAGAAARFEAELERRGDYIETVALNSPGGSLDDALAIAAAIRERGYGTSVAAGAVCASSCPLILAAGTSRSVDAAASVGVHQIYAASARAVAEIGPAQAMSDAQTLTARITRHLVAMEVDPDLWIHAMETPPDKLYYFTREELERYRLADTAVN
ncbi:hypothetical protein [Pelagibacterium xiamenense]|uniref:COG3904 family protein n=1 Tax=Pelagibacterium xiamenense TaxID=2901140 RepID=UPI001E43E096|nr:hypothetical protein [Pelagibacterium xiamenense]MCD7058354.1 hypothetical protein [Pelagibacterium xiamenense]